VNSLTSFNLKVVLFLATKPLTCAHINSVKTEDTVCPNFSQKKAVLQSYLTQHNIPFSATDTKKVLYEKIKQKKTPVIYKTDNIAHLHGHEVLRTPVRHCELNAYLHAKQSSVCLYPRVFLGHQTHHSDATYNLCSDFG
jgi:hypothetical protein